MFRQILFLIIKFREKVLQSVTLFFYDAIKSLHYQTYGVDTLKSILKSRFEIVFNTLLFMNN